MRLTFIRGEQPWRKQISRVRDKISSSGNYHQTRFDTEEVEADSLEEVFSIMKEKADEGKGFLRGNLDNPLINQARRGASYDTPSSRLVFLDVDGLNVIESNIETAKTIVHQWLSIPNVKFFVHFSSSARVKGGFKAHIAMELDREVDFSIQKEFFEHRQTMSGEFRNAAELDGSFRIVQYPIDTTSFTKSQVFTIAKPEFKGMSDPFEGDSRWELVEGELLSADMVESERNSEYAECVYEDFKRLLEESGKRKPGRKPKQLLGGFKEQESWTYVDTPMAGEASDMREDGGFIRFNMNGGDSLSYWHHKDDIKYAYTFKGMLKYPLSRLAPDYYKILEEELSDRSVMDAAQADSDRDNGYKMTRLELFSSPDAKALYRIRLDNEALQEKTWDDVLETPYNVTTLRYLLKDDPERVKNIHKGQEVLRVVDTYWEPGAPFYKPATDIDLPSLNKYVLPEMPAEVPSEPPEWFTALAKHVVYGHETMYKTLLDWVSWILIGKCPMSAWLWQGTQGTGKGLLIHTIANVLGGRDRMAVYPFSRSPIMASGDKKDTTAQMDCKQLTVIEEVNAVGFKNPKVMDNLKVLITEPEILIEKKHHNPTIMKNRQGIILTSNAIDSIVLATNDRRVHVPPRQEEPIAGSSTYGVEFTMKLLDEISKMGGGSEDIVQLRGWLYNRGKNLSDRSIELLKSPNQHDADTLAYKRETVASGATEIVEFVNLLNGVSSRTLSEYYILNAVSKDELLGFRGITDSRVEKFCEMLETFRYFLNRPDELKVPGTPAKFGVTVGDLAVLKAVLIDPEGISFGSRFTSYLAHSGFSIASHNYKVCKQLKFADNGDIIEGKFGSSKRVIVPYFDKAFKEDGEAAKMDILRFLDEMRELGYHYGNQD